MRIRTCVPSAVVAAVIAGAVVLGAAAPATAQVSIDSVLPQGDGTVALVITVARGCAAGESTTGLSVEVPEGSAIIGATEQDGWSHVADGSRIDFSGPAIPEGELAEFIVTARIGAQPGESVILPVVQTCEGGAREDWTREQAQVPESAPRFVATADTVDRSLDVVRPPDRSAGADDRETWAAIMAFLALTTGVAFVETRRRSRPRP